MLKFFLKKISKKITNKQDRSNINLYLSINKNKNKLILCDVGGAGGLQPRWEPVEEKIKVIFFEPDKRSSIELKKRGFEVIEQCLWNEKTEKKFYLTKKSQTSSLYKPNKPYLNLFPDAGRFDIVNVIDVSVDQMDNFIDKFNQPHFIKLDVQGAELNVLKGSNSILKNVLGLEIEVNFKYMYENIPLAHDVEKYLNDHRVLEDDNDLNRPDSNA